MNIYYYRLPVIKFLFLNAFILYFGIMNALY